MLKLEDWHLVCHVPLESHWKHWWHPMMLQTCSYSKLSKAVPGAVHIYSNRRLSRIRTFTPDMWPDMAEAPSQIWPTHSSMFRANCNYRHWLGRQIVNTNEADELLFDKSNRIFNTLAYFHYLHWIYHLVSTQLFTIWGLIDYYCEIFGSSNFSYNLFQYVIATELYLPSNSGQIFVT